MITQFRRYTESWIARGFFLIMAVAFVGWGVSGDLSRLMGPPAWIAKVAGQTIDIPAFQVAFQQALAQQTLDQLIAQAALDAEIRKLGITTPDDALAASVRAMPDFVGKNGTFDHDMFTSLLQANGYTEARFLARLRTAMNQQQLLSMVTNTVVAPDAEVKPLYEAQYEKRSADMAFFPLDAAPAPATPTQAELDRWYANHKDSYATPEYRRIKAIELSPQSLASEITITDADLHAAYDQQKSQYQTEEKRSAQVISTQDEAKAHTLAAAWRTGADWAAMQAAAKAAGASSIQQDDAVKVQFPDPDLAKTVFATPADAVSDPVKGQLGWFVVKVTKVTPGASITFDEAKDALRAHLLAAKAADLMYDRANKLDQLLGNGSGFDNLPGDLGLAGIAGTMDVTGTTQAGEPAPIPGATELRSAIITAAFKAHQGDQPQLVEVQTPSTGGSSYYALVVENIIPPGTKPYDEVKQKVADDWAQDQRHRVQDAAATTMMLAVQGGKSFSDAATIAGVTPHLSPLVGRDQGTQDVPPDLQRVMFGLKLHEATMMDTVNGFVVAQLAEIQKPDPAKDKLGYDRAKTAVAKSISDDMAQVLVSAIRQRFNPQINQAGFDSVVQAQ
ncbi:MAG TPA: peptidyl-prolyl cis-trans isomerase [Rhodopila sp.]|nr:peptidyl-prolyl cis-trans isomerase [Rhodopila sp.]